MFRSRSSRTTFRPVLEGLESRLVPYSVTGYSWPSPQLITLSFVPDGTYIMGSNTGPLYSNLYSRMSNFWPGSMGLSWQNSILKAAQMWAQQTNLNFSFVSDNGTAMGKGSYQQGDPGMGDIRFSAIDLGTASGVGSTVTYAEAFYPPTYTGDSTEGDIQFNNNYRYGNYTTGILDIWTLAEHELGHALGLGHTNTNGLAVMWPEYYTRNKLTADDIAGIQSIYGGPRKTDRYESAGQGVSFATAVDVSSQISPTALTAVVSGLDNTTSTDAGYYSFTAPAGSAASATVTVQSSGLSLFAPVLTVYAADQTTVLGTATATAETGATLSVTLSNVAPGTKYFVKVSGNASVGGSYATGAFATGAYALTLNLGTGPAPTVPLPNTQLGLGTNWMGGPAGETNQLQPDGYTNTGEESPLTFFRQTAASGAATSLAAGSASAAPASGSAAVSDAATSLALSAGSASAPPAASVTPAPAVSTPAAPAAEVSLPARPANAATTDVGSAQADDATAPVPDVAQTAGASVTPSAEAAGGPMALPSAGPSAPASAPATPATGVETDSADAIFSGQAVGPYSAPSFGKGATLVAVGEPAILDHALLAASLGLAWAYLPGRTPRRGDRRPSPLGFGGGVN